MSARSSSSSGSGVLKSKSPAEFFAEHQNIAGFDNPGKSLYTTIREFVENSLDAAEAVRTLPDIRLTIEKLSQREFNLLRGVEQHTRADHALFQSADAKKATKAKAAKAASAKAAASEGGDGEEAKESEDKASESSQYFRVTCRDNGGGMPHASIPQMLGVVLSSTKYGVKQTRGKFGLGAKMALVWAMKSTGLPIQVHSATSAHKPISYAKLYIDINKNQPDIVTHEQRPNTDSWQGTEISVVIGGAWRLYQSKIVNYMRQLAVITPYAQIQLEFIDQDHDSKSWTILFDRRTDVMPTPPVEVKHHPSSVDNLLVEQLIHHAKPNTRVKNFLRTSFSSISAALADRLCEELASDFNADTDVQELGKKQIHQLTSLLRSAKFGMPDASCLSAAGEYNLRLGILKELNPEMVATASQAADVTEGHPFQVEAAVSLGGAKAKSGISVYRYANRIPLLFEGSNDVVSLVANKKIKWSVYKVNPNRDKISVFVSIVSTKIPFKGTSKEYIGDDKDVMHACIKKAITACCVQLRKRITTAQALRTKADRKKQMAKYIPDVSRSLMAVLHAMADPEGVGASMLVANPAVVDADEPGAAAAKRRADETARQKFLEMVDKLRIKSEEQDACRSLLRDVQSELVTDELLESRLRVAVDAKDAELESANAMDADESHDGDHAAHSNGTACFVAGLDTENMDMKTAYGEDFKITFW